MPIFWLLLVGKAGKKLKNSTISKLVKIT